MTLSRHRKQRAAESQRIVANYFRTTGLAPHAVAVGAGAPGRDVLNVPDVATEVKARRDLNLPSWLRQARDNAGDDLPMLVVRGDGQGPASIAEWAAVMPLGDMVRLLQVVQVLRTILEATDARDDAKSIGVYVEDALRDLFDTEDEPGVEDEDPCSHTWPGEVTEDAQCTNGCGLTYGGWSL